MGFVRLLLLAFTTFAASITSAVAGTINVDGSVIYGPLLPGGVLPGATIGLTGDRDFTFNGFALGLSNIIHPASQCSVGCPPGSTISLTALAINTDILGQATLDGVSHFLSGSPLGPNIGLQFSGQVVAPVFGASPTAFLTVPVNFAGRFNVGLLQQNELVADARATLQLEQVDCPLGSPLCSGQGWQYQSIRYDLEPVPEPGTLLLFGSAMAGLGLAWRRRG